MLAVRNPNVSGSYGVCPFKAVTGWDCPFCGGLRGTYALIHGDVATALDRNVLLPVLARGHGRLGVGGVASMGLHQLGAFHPRSAVDHVRRAACWSHSGWYATCPG